jgi:hypothetical protein
MPDRALGLLPATPNKPRLKLAPHLTTALDDQPPTAIDYLSRVPGWPLYANDRIGDCGPSALYHAITAAGTYGDGSPYVAPESEVIDFYSAVTGYDPRTGADDTGVILQDMLAAAVKRGTILAFAEVTVTDHTEVLAALHLFGHLLIGANMPTDAEKQTDAGHAWDVTTSPGGTPGSWGGHAVHVGAHYDGKGHVCTTWGQTQSLTDAWWATYVQEAWIVITPEWFAANGQSPTGLDLHGLGNDYATLTGRTNPFPEVTPTPAPQAPTDPLAALAADPRLTKWRHTRHTGDNAYAARVINVALGGRA